MKYTPEEILDPRMHEDMMVRDPQDTQRHENHGI